MSDYSELKRLAEAAQAECVDSGVRWPEGDDWFEPDLHELAYLKAASPAAVLALIAENDRLLESDQEATELCDTLSVLLGEVAVVVRGPEEPKSRHGFYDLPLRVKTVVAGRDQLKAENETLRRDRTDWQAECLKRGFEYVRESDDHYVLADVPEMADLLGRLLGVEVRSKDNDAYEEANSQLNEQIEGLVNTIHRQESFRKDADRFQFIARDAESGLEKIYGDDWLAVVDFAMTGGDQL